MIYLLDVAKIVTIPLIPKALGLPRAICYSGLHFGPCKIRYSELAKTVPRICRVPY